MTEDKFCTVSVNGRVLTVSYGGEALAPVDTAAFRPSVMEAAVLHGVEQVLRDVAAQNSAKKFPRTSERRDRCLRTARTRVEAWAAGMWAQAERAWSPRCGWSLFFDAVAEVTGRPRNAVECKKDGTRISVDEWRAHSTNKKLAAVIARMEQERADAALAAAGNDEDDIADLFGDADDE